jgi:hypothetical protein
MMLVATVAVVLCGCGDLIERRAMATTAAIAARSRAALEQESDLGMARAAIPPGIKQLEGFHLAVPDERGFTVLLAEATCQYASGFLQFDAETARLAGDAERARELADRGTSMALRCVSYALELLDGSWTRAVYEDPAALPDLIAAAGAGEQVGLFWLGLGLASAGAMSPQRPALLLRLPAALAMLERSLAIDERFQHGLGHVAVGAAQAARPRFLGGDPELGKRHLERAFELSGRRNLVPRVALARYYAVAIGDRELFRRTLIEVLQTPPSIWPEMRLGNEMAHEQARTYLEYEDSWFGAQSL